MPLEPEPQADRARARAAVLLLGPTAAIGLVGLAASFAANPGGLGAGTWYSLGAILALVAGSLLARHGHGVAGVVLAVAAMEAAIWGLYRLSDPATREPALDYLLIPLLVAGLTLPPAWAVGVSVATVAALAPLAAAVSGLGLVTSLQEHLTLLILLALIGVVAVVSSIVQDHTLKALERRAADLQRTTDALAEASAERARLLQQLTHDLASPLTPVQIQLRLLEKQVTASGRHGLAVVKRNVQHVQRLVEDLKDVARLEGGELSLSPEATDLSELARQAVETLGPAAAEREVALEVQAPVPAPVSGDPGRLTQVLYNLVMNALKFTPPGGHVDVRVEVRAGAGGGWATVAVQDDGDGMTPEQVARLFRPFSQVHGPAAIRRPEDKGTGLGLYISKGLVEAHGGSIQAESAGPGRGSTFTFRLPLAAPGTP